MTTGRWFIPLTTILPLIKTAIPQTLTALLDNGRSPPQHHHQSPVTNAFVKDVTTLARIAVPVELLNVPERTEPWFNSSFLVASTTTTSRSQAPSTHYNLYSYLHSLFGNCFFDRGWTTYRHVSSRIIHSRRNQSHRRWKSPPMSWESVPISWSVT